MAVKAHRLANYAQQYESYRSLVSLMDARALLDTGAVSDDDLAGSLEEAETQFYDGIRSFNETEGQEALDPVLINGIIYQAVEGHPGLVIRIDPCRMSDIVTHKSLVPTQS